jgi:Na+-translocating ferredoxin:NAD+ oxidoreductase RNF subunit RnfB
MTTWLLPIIIVVSLGLIAGIILSIAGKFFTVEKNPLTEKVRAELPGINCGACGYVGCDPYAEALTSVEGAMANLCIPGGGEVVAKICEILDIPQEEVASKYAVLLCSGTLDKTEYVMDWRSLQSCAANKLFYRGRGACYQTCLGYGDCVKVCPHDAIIIENGVAIISRARCVGCGLCIPSCPNHLLHLMTGDNYIYVACKSNAKGGDTRKACTAGCIACKKCEKVCEFDAIHVEHNLATIDQNKCTQCGACVEACPVGVIKWIREGCDV